MFKTFPYSVALEDLLKAADAQTCKLEKKNYRNSVKFSTLFTSLEKNSEVRETDFKWIYRIKSQKDIQKTYWTEKSNCSLLIEYAILQRWENSS